MSIVATRPQSGNTPTRRPAAFHKGNSIFSGGLIQRDDVPSCRSHWRGCFTHWVSELFAESRQSGADLFPEPGTRAAQIQDLADIAVLCQPFNLADPSVAPRACEASKALSSPSSSIQVKMKPTI